jgi:cytochrome o ubiquinol oxidase subunit II
MKRSHALVGILAVAGALLAVILVLMGEGALLTHPKGIIAHKELDLMVVDVLLMLSVIVPTCIALFIVVWNRSKKESSTDHDPEHTFGPRTQVILWAIPSVIVAVMATLTWYATYELDPFRPLLSEKKPLSIQVVALDWKWLFIYPEQEIATVNLVRFPAKTPIHFELSADNSPMNSFWVPQLSGQIYTMTGMVTSLHIMADAPGEFAGRAAEINGEGFADMTFKVQACSDSDFEEWVSHVKQSPLQLTAAAYNELVTRSVNNPVVLYSHVDNDLFQRIVAKPLKTPTAP